MKNKKRVCMVVLSYYPKDPRVRREAEVLNDNGLAVDILCLRSPEEEGLYHYENITAYRILKGTEDKENIIKYVIFSIIFSAIAFFKLLSLTFKFKYRIIQFHNMPDYLVFIGILHKLLGIPIILDLHDLSVELFESKWHGKKSKILLPFVKFVEKISCKFSNKLITTSIGFQNHLIKRGIDPDKISLIMNTADEKIFLPKKQRTWRKIINDPKILYHGTITKRFGIHIAIQAIELLSSEFPEIQFILYGKYDPTYKEEIESLILEKELTKNIILNSYLSLEEIAEKIETVDMGLVPYLSDGFMDLALSTKTFEYIKMGCPIAASRIPSITSLFDDSSIWYCEPGNANEMANTIKSICNNPEATEEKTKNAMMTYSKFSWRIMASDYLKLIENTMK